MATSNNKTRILGEKLTNTNRKDILYNYTVILLGLGFGLLHRWHVSTLFENDRHFSHLSEIEREMSFRTEMGMYYFYYKQIVQSETPLEGMNKLKEDNLSEYNNVIDATRKYNLYPELSAGFFYHLMKNLDLLPEQRCWQVERGNGLSPVTSCEGLGVPIYFYLEIVWICAALTGMILFYYSVFLSKSIIGGILTMLFFFYNHNECTRVQWTPPLRESFAYPMMLTQMYFLTKLLRKYSEKDSINENGLLYKEDRLSWAMLIVTSVCHRTWQFSPFFFLTQIFVLLVLKWTKIIPPNLYNTFSKVHTSAIAVTIIFTGFTSIIWSLYTCLLIANRIADRLTNKLSEFIEIRSKVLIEIALTILVTRLLKNYVYYSEDDSHVYNILRSKLFDFKDFHTMLYTCSPEFDFLQLKTYEIIIKTLLFPTAVLTGILVLYYWYRNLEYDRYPKCVEAEMAYNGLQTGAFIVMAVFIMRLKLFMTPHLCIIAGGVYGQRYLKNFGVKNQTIRLALVAALVAGMSYHGIDRIYEERGYFGEFNHVEQEELFHWIIKNTPEQAAFAGKMSLMANLMLSTKRPIVNNPWYESKEMRDRTMKIYEIFSRKEAVRVYTNLRNMGVRYLVLERSLCLGTANLQVGCQMIDLWDEIDHKSAKLASKPPLCPTLFQGNSPLFRRVFINEGYVVLDLDYPNYVELEPKISIPFHYHT